VILTRAISGRSVVKAEDLVVTGLMTGMKTGLVALTADTSRKAVDHTVHDMVMNLIAEQVTCDQMTDISQNLIPIHQTEVGMKAVMIQVVRRTEAIAGMRDRVTVTAGQIVILQNAGANLNGETTRMSK
jgi:hypothetical protein